MRTNKNITDKYDRALVCMALMTLRNTPISESDCRYLHFPINSAMYGVFDKQLKKLITVLWLANGIEQKIEI